MNLFVRAVSVCLAALVFASPALAADENPLLGQWVDPLPNGAAMITEFTEESVSFWAVSPTGEESAANKAPVTYRIQDNGGISVAIKGQEDAPLMAVMRGANAVDMVFPGMASKRLMRRQPKP